MQGIKLIAENTKNYASYEEIENLSCRIGEIHRSLENKDCLGNDFLGWLDLPINTKASLIGDIQDAAKMIKKKSDVFVNLGIGGSYLGAKAAIEFIKPAFFNERKEEKPKIYFAGHNLSADYLSDLMNLFKNKDIVVNVISKSGTTTETAVVFRLLKEYMDKKYGKNKVKDRIICTTDKEKGALRRFADKQGYKTFIIPDDVGGRFSVLTPVGLLPIACAGIDISELLKGARDARKKYNELDLNKNLAYKYAAIRYVLYKKGKEIEILSGFHPALHYIGEWWKQLFGESEGKDNKGIFPVSCDFSTDLHSMGQIIQEGKRNVFETFLTVKESSSNIKLPKFEEDIDGLNYLAGKEVDYINQKAYEGTARAHYEGGVPNMTIEITKRDAYCLGQLFYFFEKAVAVSGLLLGVNPFNQPGVEAYKKKMFELLGKPGY